MRKWWVIPVLGLLFTGCTAQETLETIADAYVQPAAAQVRQVNLQLPEEASVTVMQSDDTGTLYLCDGYAVTVQTLASGDLDRTLRETTGFSRDALTVIETQPGSWKRYDCVWSAAGEGEDQVGRAAVLDDGDYHYVLSVMASFTQAGDLAEVWQEIFDSFSLDYTAA